MASEKLKSNLNPHNSRVVFPDGFVCTPPQPPHQLRPSAAVGHTSKTSAAANFHFFQPQQLPQQFPTQRNTETRGDDSSDDDDDLDEDDEIDDDDEEDMEERSKIAENVVTVAKVNDSGRSNDDQKMKLAIALGVNEGDESKHSGNESTNYENSSSANAGRIEYHYRQYENHPSTSLTQKDVVGSESCCGFSGRKEGQSTESIRSIFSDPISGMLMDDAMILPCGHSFGSGGMQHITRAKACYICSKPVSEDSIFPNLSLRIAVQAFKREEELHAIRISKRRRERYDQDKGTTSDSTHMEFSSGRAIQFPFAVTDRVIIKGNKRTPPRFVGREAVVTTQCLNGWYVVKTSDNAESVKLQYRSLAKISDNDPSMKPSTIKTTTPNWL